MSIDEAINNEIANNKDIAMSEQMVSFEQFENELAKSGIYVKPRYEQRSPRFNNEVFIEAIDGMRKFFGNTFV